MSDTKQTPEVDIETMPLDELAKLAFDVAHEEEPTPEATPAAEVTPEKKTFRQEIDLGDGSGKQVFEADSMEGLVDALAQAQTHATKKIRELSRDKKVETAAGKEPEHELTADEEWLLSQELLNHPSKTQKKLIEGLLGMPIEQFKSKLARLDENDLAQQAQEATEQFLARHADDYHRCPENQQKLVAYMDTFKLGPSVDSLEKAFNDLNKSGLLVGKPKEAPVTDEGAESDTADHQEPSRIASKTVATPVTPQRRAGSGISTKGRSTIAPVRSQPTEQDLYEMPLDKLEQLANAELRSGK